MKKLSSNFYKKIIVLVAFFFGIFCENCVAQSRYTMNLNDDFRNLQLNSYILRFVPVDSILDEKNEIRTNIIKELTEIKKLCNKNFYYLIKIGFYQSDATGSKTNSELFLKVKKHLHNISSNRIIIIDANCQSVSSVRGDAFRYEDKTGSKLKNSFYFNLYKSKNKILQVKYKKACYL
jgi:hypothetical protein